MRIQNIYRYLKKDSIIFISNNKFDIIDQKQSLFIYNNIIYNNNYIYQKLLSSNLYKINYDSNKDKNNIIKIDTILNYILKIFRIQ
jgi:hypothetical protein